MFTFVFCVPVPIQGVIVHQEIHSYIPVVGQHAREGHGKQQLQLHRSGSEEVLQ